MFVQAFTVLLPFVLQAAASPCQSQSVFKKSDDCPTGPTGVHIIGIRATTEKPGFGALKPVVDNITARLPGSDSIPIDYSASGIIIEPDGTIKWNFTEYKRSVADGLANFTAELVNFTQRCPGTGVVVLGYSQGAQVIGDGLCGVSELPFPPWPAIPHQYTASIKAIIQLGDPTNRKNLPWHAGTSTRGGIFPRLEFAECKEYGGFWQSYCDSGDPFCDRGDDLEVHLGYVKKYQDNIVDFVVEKVTGSQSRGFEYRVMSDDL